MNHTSVLDPETIPLKIQYLPGGVMPREKSRLGR